MRVPVKLQGYAPDADPTIVGILTNCSSLIPTYRGMAGAPSAQSVGQTALAGTCQGAAVLTKLDNTTRFLAGTAKTLYEAQSGNWTNIGRAATYTLSTSSRWRFAQLGNAIFASSENDTVQFSTGGVFADISAAPQAAIIETVNNFLFAFDTNDGTYGDSPNRWMCAGVGGYTSWTPSVSTQAATNTLTSTPGKITAGRRFGNQIVVYKEKAMYLGTYVGPPLIWDFQEIPGSAGALSQEVVVNVGTPEQPKHIFMGYDNFYQFDGGRPVPIPNWVRNQVFYSELNRAQQGICTALHDPVKSTVRFYYPAGSSTTCNACVVYNYRTGLWGRDDRSVEAAVDFVASSGTSYDSLGTSYSTYDDLPAVGYDSAFLSTSTPVPAILDTSHIVRSLTGTSVSSSLTTGDFGDNSETTLLDRVTPKFLQRPSSATMVNYYRSSSADSLSSGAGATMDARYRFDVLQEEKWHRLSFSFFGDVELAEIVLEGQRGSAE